MIDAGFIPWDIDRFYSCILRVHRKKRDGWAKMRARALDKFGRTHNAGVPELITIAYDDYSPDGTGSDMVDRLSENAGQDLLPQS